MKSILRALAVAALFLPFSIHAADALSEGTVKKIDKAAGKLTLAHGPIDNLGMPGMTMAFKVKPPTLLKKIKAGDKVRFRAEQVDGAYTVVRIESANPAAAK